MKSGYGNKAFHLQYFHASIEKYIHITVHHMSFAGWLPETEATKILAINAIINAATNDFHEKNFLCLAARADLFLISFCCSILFGDGGNAPANFSVIGLPHPIQIELWSDIIFPQSGHFINPILSLLFQVQISMHGLHNTIIGNKTPLLNG